MKIVASLFAVALFATPLAVGCGSAEEPVTGTEAPGLGTESVCPLICSETPCRLSNGSCSITCNGCFCAREGGTVDKTCPGGITPESDVIRFPVSDAGVHCGSRTCPAGEICCADCGAGICVGPGGRCPAIACVPNL